MRGTTIEFEGSMWNVYTQTCADISQFKTTGFGLYKDEQPTVLDRCGNLAAPDGEGNLLFDNNTANFAGGVVGLTVLNTEELEDGWTKYTVQLAEDLSNGIYYLKGRNYNYNWYIA